MLKVCQIMDPDFPGNQKLTNELPKLTNKIHITEYTIVTLHSTNHFLAHYKMKWFFS